MIHKVNRPDFQLIVSRSKAAENDPGGSQGSGVAYEGASDQSAGSSSDPKNSNSEPTPESPSRNHPGLAVVVPMDEIGLGEVVLEFKGKGKPQGTGPGLSVRYLGFSKEAKGLLLNRKA